MDNVRHRTMKRLSTLQGCVERATHGSLGGTYELRVKSFSGLNWEHVYESDLFELGGHKGKIIIYRGRPHGFECVKFALVSCSDCGIRARVGWSIESRPSGRNIAVRNASKAAVPFSIVDLQDIRLCDLTDNLDTLDFELVVKVRIRNIEEINRDELRRANKDVRTVRLEIIPSDTITAWVEDNEFGLVPPTRTLHSYVYHDSLLRFWSEDGPLNYRYWSCKRAENGDLFVQRYLHASSPLEVFGSICDLGGGIPWVTLFREEKKNGEIFQPIEDDSVIVFCKQIDPPCDLATYLGHIISQKSKSCQDLLKEIAETMMRTTLDQSYHCYLGDDRHLVDITRTVQRLDECGFKSGSTVLIVGPDDEGSCSIAEAEDGLKLDGCFVQRNDCADHSCEAANGDLYLGRPVSP